MSGKFGFSWSWKRAIGLSQAKSRISREIGIPLTKQGRERKIGAWMLGETQHHAHDHSGQTHHRRRYHAHIGWGMILLLAATYVYNLVAGKNPPAPPANGNAEQTARDSG